MVTRSSSLSTACALTLGLFQLMCSSAPDPSTGASTAGSSGDPGAAGSATTTGGAATQGGASAVGGMGAGTAGTPVACPPGDPCKPVLPGDIVPLYGPT